jgi:hypothetical protein
MIAGRLLVVYVGMCMFTERGGKFQPPLGFIRHVNKHPVINSDLCASLAYNTFILQALQRRRVAMSRQQNPAAPATTAEYRTFRQTSGILVFCPRLRIAYCWRFHASTSGISADINCSVFTNLKRHLKRLRHIQVAEWTRILNRE